MEVAVGLIGATATVGAAKLAVGSGFTGRHESSHREELMETKRNMSEFLENLKSGEVTQEEEVQFLKTMDETNQRQNEYHESIESYKKMSWVPLPPKMKKRTEVRKAKRLTRQSNHSLRSLNGSMHSGCGTSSIYACAGSPPGSSLAKDDIQDWTRDVHMQAAPDAPAVHRASLDGGERITTPPLRLLRRASLPAQPPTFPRVVDDGPVRDPRHKPNSFKSLHARSFLLELYKGRRPEPATESSRRTKLSTKCPHKCRLYRTEQPLEPDFNRNPSQSSSSSDFAFPSLMRSARQEPRTQPPELDALPVRRRNPSQSSSSSEFAFPSLMRSARQEPRTQPPELNAPPVRRLRKGMWNRRGDHLTPDGYIVFAPAAHTYPTELSDYPHETDGYRDHMGETMEYVVSRLELRESLPLRGQPPECPYEAFLQYVTPQEFRARRASSAQLSPSLPRKLSLSDIQAALSPRDAALPSPRNIEADSPDFISDAWQGLADRSSRFRQDVRRLEAKVAKVAAKKTTVGEIVTLYKELQEWLTSDVKPDDDTSSLTLSAALLHTILTNHVAASEAIRSANSVAATLKSKLDDMELMNGKLDQELRRQVNHKLPDPTLNCLFQRLQYQSTSNEPDIEDIQILLESFLANASEFGFFLHEGRFYESALLLDGSKRPTPALLQAAYTCAAHFLHLDHEERFLEAALQCAATDLAAPHPHPQAFLHTIQAEVLISHYFFRTGRLIEARVHAGTAVALALGGGLHQIRSLHNHDIPILALSEDGGVRHLHPPADAIEEGERINAFWVVFMLHRNLAVALDPSAQVCGVFDTASMQIDTPWPLDMVGYIQGRLTAAVHGDSTVRNFLNQPVAPSSSSLMELNVKACILLHRAVYMNAEWKSTVPSRDADAHWQSMATALHVTDQFINTLRAQLPNVAQLSGRSSVRTILLTRSLLNAATIKLHDIFMYSDPTSRQNCVAAARDMFHFGELNLHGLTCLHPIMGTLWMTACYVLADELKRLRSLQNVLHMDARADDEEDIYSYFQGGITALRIFERDSVLMNYALLL